MVWMSSRAPCKDNPLILRPKTMCEHRVLRNVAFSARDPFGIKNVEGIVGRAVYTNGEGILAC